jgi:gliding motility-associated-like protein
MLVNQKIYLNKKIFSLIIICLFIFTITYSQVHRCGTDSIHAIKMQNAEYAAQHSQKLTAVQGYIDHLGAERADCANTLLIPVAVHFQGMGGGFDMACATQMAVDQVNILNNDYAGTNADIINWNNLNPTIWPGINNGESCIEFCLATLDHPAGFGLSDGDYAVTVNQTVGDFDAAWSGYINFWVRNLGGGILGFSPLGGSGNGDGVTCEITAFGSINCGGNTVNAPYNLGRTVTHELGHYLMLEHPWAAGGCASNDGVADTPVTDAPTFGCPANNTITCVDPILWPSYMEYCDDLCLFMFSQGQIDKSEAYVNTSLMNLLGSSAIKCVEAQCADYVVNSNFVNESCAGNDGTITLVAEGGTAPYNFSINNGTTEQPAGLYTSLGAGSYEVLVTDDAGCIYEETIDLEVAPPVINIISIENTYCGADSGQVEVSVASAGVFEYSIDGEATFQDAPIFNNLPAGVYDLVAKSDNCMGSVPLEILDISDFTVEIISLKPINCPLFDNGSISMRPLGGKSPFSYTLDGVFESTNGFFDELSIGKHNVFIIDSKGCSATLDFTMQRSYTTIGDDCPCTMYIPNAMTNNADGLNDLFSIIPSCPVADFELRIYDRWGSKVYESFDYKEKWNGGTDKYFVPNGIYNYKISYRWGEAADISIEVQTESGIIHVLR